MSSADKKRAALDTSPLLMKTCLPKSHGDPHPQDPGDQSEVSLSLTHTTKLYFPSAL